MHESGAGGGALATGAAVVYGPVHQGQLEAVVEGWRLRLEVEVSWRSGTIECRSHHNTNTQMHRVSWRPRLEAVVGGHEVGWRSGTKGHQVHVTSYRKHTTLKIDRMEDADCRVMVEMNEAECDAQIRPRADYINHMWFLSKHVNLLRATNSRRTPNT